MKNYFLIILLFFSISPSYGEELTIEEKKKISEEVKSMLDAFNKGDAQKLLDKTHPSIYALSGGKEKFEQQMLLVVKQAMQLKIKFEKFEVRLPGKLYKSGEHLVCFIPRSSIFIVDGKKIASESYFIAAKTEGSEWKYLDGGGMRGAPQKIYQYFPDLPKVLELPDNTVELVKP